MRLHLWFAGCTTTWSCAWQAPANVRHGLVPEDYARHVEYKGQEVALASESQH